MQGMLGKQDELQHTVGRMRQDLGALGTEMQQHAHRLDVMQDTLQQHNSLHEVSIARLDALETQAQDFATQAQFRDLEAQIQELKELEQRVRELQQQVRQGGTPRGSGTPRISGSLRDSEMDLQLVVGGWKQAPKHLAEKEVKSLFQMSDLKNCIESTWSPFARTNFLRVALKFPTDCVSLPQQRSFQMEALQKLRKDKWKSSIAGSENTVLWIARHRSPQERHKIRAILQTKDFCDQLPPHTPATPHPRSEFDWRGNVYVGSSQVLISPHTPNARHAHPADVQLTDARGGHTGWAVSATRSQRPRATRRTSFHSSGLSAGEGLESD